MLERLVMKAVVIVDCVFLPGDANDLAFVWMESHFPLLLPLCQFVEVFLEVYAVRVVCYSKVGDRIVRKKAYCGIKTMWNVVDVKEKKAWTKHRALWDTRFHIHCVRRLPFEDY